MTESRAGVDDIETKWSIIIRSHVIKAPEKGYLLVQG